ncbi:MAG: hypothetical protein J6T51_03465 [Kiritimatiellae bacterium]|nr:hypothetical protein [Kiritimatiellia bacterium]
MKRGTLFAAIAAFCVATASAPSFGANVADLAISLSGDTVNVTVPAGALDTTSKLYLAYDSSDRGDDLSAWPAANRILYSGAVTSAAATYQFDGSGIPAGMIVRAFATSDTRLINSYVKLQGNQYIDTGVVDTSAYGVDFKFRPLSASTGGNYASVIGSGVDQFTIGMYNSHVNYYLRYGGNGASTSGDAYNPAFALSDLTIPHVFRIFGGTAYLDGAEVKTKLNDGTQAKKCGGAVASTGHTVLLGVSWNKGSGTTSLSGRYCHGEWHYAKVLNSSGGAIVNLVPALRGDTTAPEAGFYDMVSGEFFAKSGTGGALAYDTSATVTNTVTKLSAKSDYIATGMMAWWTGGGDRANVNDPDNWACTNAAGVAVANAVPDVNTAVKITGPTTFNVPAGQTLSYANIDFTGASLAADCDWSGLAASVTRLTRTVLEYLDAPKNAYIDTGFKPNSKTSVIADVTVLDQTKADYWFGAWNTSYKGGAFAVCNDSGSLYSGYGDSGGGSNPKLGAGRHVINFTNGVVNVDGAMHTDRSGQAAFQVNYNLYIFGQNRAGTFTPGSSQVSIRFHSFKIFDDGVLVRDYVPVIYGGEVCLYDRENDTYAYNAGSGAFVAGTQTSDVTYHEVTEATTINSPVDLAGHTLTFSDVGVRGTLTDATGGGAVKFDVGAGMAVTNSTLELTGLLKVVKTGAGTFVGAKADQTYTGGTIVSNGWAKSGAYSGAWGPDRSLITVVDGAGFDWGCMVNSSSAAAYSFSLAGEGPGGAGAMTSNPNLGGVYAYNMIADMELADDALIVVGKSVGTAWSFIGFSYLNGANTEHLLTLNGHTLSIVSGDRFGFRCVRTVGAGKVKMLPNEGSAGYMQASFYGGASDFSSATLEITKGTLFNVEAAFPVGTLIDAREVKDRAGTARTVTVTDRLVPEYTNLFSNIVLGDATHLSPTLDLSALNAPYDIHATEFSFDFALGAAVTVDVGTRATAVGDKLVSWSAMPDASVSFTFAYDGADRGQTLAVKPDGLYVKSSAVPEYARWDVGAETPGWKFYDANDNVVPDWEGGITADIQVRFASYEEYIAIAAQSGITPAAFVLTGGFTLPAGEGIADMSGGFAFEFAEGVVIDLNGRAAVLPDAMMYGTKPLTVTSGVDGAQLVVGVASGETKTISAMALSGGLALVKDGAGTLVAAKGGQTYTGGTFVNGGWLKCTSAATPCGAAGSLVTVTDGAGYDWAQQISTSTTMYSFDLAGMGPGGAGALLFSTRTGGYTSYCLKDLTLSDDALVVDQSPDVNVYCGFIVGGPHALTLNNHTLTIDAGAKFNFCKLNATDTGTIVFMTTQSGLAANRMASFWDGPIDLSGVTFDVGPGIRFNDDANNIAYIVIGTLIDRRTGDEAAVGNDGITILDRFQPMTTNLLQKVVLGDATHLSPVLDLSALDGPFVLPDATYTLSAAEGATVQVKLGDRRVRSSVPLITWTTKPANIDSIDFAAYDKRGLVKVADDGVYLHPGFLLIVR